MVTIMVTTITMVTIIVTMVDDNPFCFNKCNFGIRSGFKKETQKVCLILKILVNFNSTL